MSTAVYHNLREVFQAHASEGTVSMQAIINIMKDRGIHYHTDPRWVSENILLLLLLYTYRPIDSATRACMLARAWHWMKTRLFALSLPLLSLCLRYSTTHSLSLYVCMYCLVVIAWWECTIHNECVFTNCIIYTHSHTHWQQWGVLKEAIRSLYTEIKENRGQSRLSAWHTPFIYIIYSIL